MSELSLQELDAQFSELLPEREALGCFGSHFNFQPHGYDPCHPHHHHHCEPKPCEPKQEHPCEPPKTPCEPQPAPCQPHHHVPCDDNSWKGGHGRHHDGYRDPVVTKPVVTAPPTTPVLSQK